MSEITADGYQSLIDFAVSETAIPNEWDYLAIYDETQSEWGRVSITGDSRFQWQDLDGDAIIEVSGTITGGDSDISLPQIFQYAAVYDSATGGRQVTQIEQFPRAKLNQTGDDVTITHTIEVPNQP